jgi:hypothetical protein
MAARDIAFMPFIHKNTHETLISLLHIRTFAQYIYIYYITLLITLGIHSAGRHFSPGLQDEQTESSEPDSMAQALHS